ncbi:MAG TPA: TonB-dependent receptor [Woeseiaceae bacterium]|nr:TonB-dependent receptor [Woeseiaceae bacterium]
MGNTRHGLAVLILTLVSQAGLAGDDWQGRPLADYLDYLNQHGLKVIYTSALVPDDVLLVGTPVAVVNLETLTILLQPYGLAAKPGPAGSLLVVRGRSGETTAATNEAAAIEEIPIPEVVVSASLHRLQYSSASTYSYLDRELSARVPAAGEEAVRITNRLPGTASDGLSAQNHVRGGEKNEVLFLFDGLRLYEPYHLKDFHALATVVNSNAISGMDFYTGAYPARYGDRMSGVMSFKRREPEKDIETELALSFFNASALSLGKFGGSNSGDWLLAVRRGNLDLIVDVVDPDRGSPDYQDYLAHVGWEFGPRAYLTLSALYSNDKILLNDLDRGEEASASYQNQLVWAKWYAEWSDRLASETLVSIIDITNKRTGNLNLPGIVSGSLSENREFSVMQLKQDWTWVANRHWMLSFGANAQYLAATYDFKSVKTVLPPFDRILDNQAVLVLDESPEPEGSQYAAYSELRWRPLDSLTLDVGLRWDLQNYTTADDDEQVSPRAAVLYRPTPGTELRLGWGRFYQAQEINELQVNDGVATFFEAQRSEHIVFNLKSSLTRNIDLDLSVYDKSFHQVRPRFENSYNTLTLVPELQFDRVRVDPQRAHARGAEIMLSRGTADASLLWWASFAWSEVEDSSAGVDTLRSWDQTSTFKAGLSWRWGYWDFSAAGEAHTGWPKSELYGELVEVPGLSPELVLTTSERNVERYSNFYSFDARISRDFGVRYGSLTAFFEVTNLLNRKNACCTEYSVLPDGALGSRQANWLPLVPSLGAVWRF